MNTLRRPEVAALLDELYDAAARTDAPLMARFASLDSAARASLLRDWRRLYGAEATEAYMPVRRPIGEWLYTLARMRDAQTIVELGTSFGLSAIHLAAALLDRGGGRLITTELSPEKAARAGEHLARAGLDHLVEIRVGDALETLRDLPPTDLLHLDGAKQLYGAVLRRVEPVLTPAAVVVADNVDFVELVGDFTAHLDDPANGYASHELVVGGAPIAVAVRLGHA